MKKLLALTALGMILAATPVMANDHQGKPGGRMEEALSKLPADKAELVRNSMKEGREEGKAERETLKKLFTEQKAIMVAPTFDKTAYLAKSKEISAVFAEVQTKRTERIADVASKLTAEERKVLADAHKGGKFHHGKRHEREAAKPE